MFKFVNEEIADKRVEYIKHFQKFCRIDFLNFNVKNQDSIELKNDTHLELNDTKKREEVKIQNEETLGNQDQITKFFRKSD